MQESERDELMAARATAAHYVRDETCTPARAIVRQAIEIERLVAQRDAWKAEAEHQYGECRAAKYGDVDYPTDGALDAYASAKYPALRVTPNAQGKRP